MKRILKVAAVTLAIGLASSALAQAVRCALDNYSMYFTGETRQEMGKLLLEYKCAAGHVTWIVK
jgi:hypothetical protein